MAGHRAGSQAAVPAHLRTSAGRPVPEAFAAARHWGSGASPLRRAARSLGPGLRCSGIHRLVAGLRVPLGGLLFSLSASHLLQGLRGRPSARCRLSLGRGSGGHRGLEWDIFLRPEPCAGCVPLGLESSAFLARVAARWAPGGLAPALAGRASPLGCSLVAAPAAGVGAPGRGARHPAAPAGPAWTPGAGQPLAPRGRARPWPTPWWAEGGGCRRGRVTSWALKARPHIIRTSLGPINQPGNSSGRQTPRLSPSPGLALPRAPQVSSRA